MNKSTLPYHYLVCLLLGLVLYSCKTRKPLTGKVNPEERTVVRDISPDLLLKKSIQYHHWSGKADARYNDGNLSQDISLTIQSIYNDQTFLSARAGMFGVTFEAALGLATADSIKGINKVNSEYYLYSFDQASRLINAPVDFPALQSLLVGNPLLSEARLVSFEINGDTATLVNEKSGFTQTLRYDRHNLQLLELQVHHPGKDFQARVIFSDYRTVQDAVSFAFKRNLDILYSGKRMTLSMDFTQVDFKSPVHIKFTIPRSYRLVH